MIQTEIEKSQAWMREFFSSHRKLTLEEKVQRITAIRGIAIRAREDANTRAYVEWLIQQIEPDLPTEAQVFRACYLDGQTARSVGRACHMDKRSVHRCNRRALEAALPIVCGLAGIYAEIEE